MIDNLSDWIALALVAITVFALMFAMANSLEELERLRRQQEGEDHVNDVH